VVMPREAALLLLTLMSLLAAEPRAGSAPFPAAGTLHVTETESEPYGTSTRQYELALEVREGGYHASRRNEKIVSAEGLRTAKQLEAALEFVAPLQRPVELDWSGLAVRIRPVDAAKFTGLKAELNLAGEELDAAHMELGILGERARRDADLLLDWNTVYGFWANLPSDIKLPTVRETQDGRAVRLEAISESAETLTRRASVSGQRRGEPRGCSKASLAEQRASLLERFSPERTDAMIASVTCLETSVTTVVLDRETGLPLSMTRESSFALQRGERKPIWLTTTTTREYEWRQGGPIEGPANSSKP